MRQHVGITNGVVYIFFKGGHPDSGPQTQNKTDQRNRQPVWLKRFLRKPGRINNRKALPLLLAFKSLRDLGLHEFTHQIIMLDLGVVAFNQDGFIGLFHPRCCLDAPLVFIALVIQLVDLFAGAVDLHRYGGQLGRKANVGRIIGQSLFRIRCFLRFGHLIFDCFDLGLEFLHIRVGIRITAFQICKLQF